MAEVRALAQEYLDKYNDPVAAAYALMDALMSGEPEIFKRGYSAESAYLVAREQFGDALTNDQWHDLGFRKGVNSLYLPVNDN